MAEFINLDFFTFYDMMVVIEIKYKGKIDILRYGGNIPGQPEGTAVFCCPDVDTINVFKVEIVQDEA